MAQSIVASFNQLASPALSPRFSETLKNVMGKISKNKLKGASLVSSLLDQVQIPSTPLARQTLYNSGFVNYWGSLIRNSSMSNSQENEFWKKLGTGDLSMIESLSRGLPIFCDLMGTEACLSSAREILNGFYNSLWIDIEQELELDAQFREKVIATVWDQKEKNRLRKILSEIKNAATAIHGNVSSEEQERLDDVHLEFPLTSDIVGFKEWVVGQNGYDNRGTNNIEIFGYYSHAPEADLAHLLAHEYAHQLIYVLGGSTIAEKMRTVKEGHNLYFEIQDVLNRKYAPVAQCLMNKNAANVSHVRLNETLAVWYETEILSKYIQFHKPALSVNERKMYAYYFNMSCEGGDGNGGGQINYDEPAHPNWHTRSNLLLMAHPFFRNLFQCSPNPNLNHCSLQ